MTLRLVALIALAPLVFSCGLFGSDDCSADSDCSGDDVCAQGECVECVNDGDCEPDEICDDGECERGTAEGEGEGEEGEGEGFCESACDCSVGEACLEGTCASAPPTCSSDAECGRPAGLCVPQTCLGLSATCAPTGEGEGEGEVPVSGVAFELRWATPGDDLDIHATKGVPFCAKLSGNAALVTTLGPLSEECDATGARDDCTFENCTASTSQNIAVPDWDDDGTRNGADPVLEIDDTSGFGPELITVAVPVAGQYLVAAHAFRMSAATTTATVRVIDGGAVVATIEAAVVATNDWADIAVVHVDESGQVECVGDVTDGVDECP